MIGLVFELEKNVCGYILIYTDSEGFFFGGFPHGPLGGVGGGVGLGIAPWTRAWVKNVSRPTKTLLVGHLIFWCIPNKGKAERTGDPQQEGLMIVAGTCSPMHQTQPCQE